MSGSTKNNETYVSVEKRGREDGAQGPLAIKGPKQINN